MKKQKQTKKPSKLDMVTTATVQKFAHNSTDSVTKRHIILACQVKVMDDEIAELASNLSRTRQYRAEVEAEIAGLVAVVAARG